jgi:hypothetical protein
MECCLVWADGPATYWPTAAFRRGPSRRLVVVWAMAGSGIGLVVEIRGSVLDRKFKRQPAVLPGHYDHVMLIESIVSIELIMLITGKYQCRNKP